MTAEHHGDAAMAAGDLFSASDWSAFRTSDVQAGAAIVVLMTGIFSFGVILYTIVLLTL
jgi:hypothetical protein